MDVLDLQLNPQAGLLSDSITMLQNVHVSNGAGGYTDDWQAVATVAGRGYHVQARQSEIEQADKPTDLDICEFVLQSVAVRGDYRLQTSDGRVYEVLELGAQPPVSIVRGRRVS